MSNVCCLVVPCDLNRRAVRYFARGDLQFDENNYLEATRLYTKALAICPLSARYHQARFYRLFLIILLLLLSRGFFRARANCFLKLHKFYHVIRDCTRALCLDPEEYQKIQFIRAKVYWKKKYYFRCWVDLV